MLTVMPPRCHGAEGRVWRFDAGGMPGLVGVVGVFMAQRWVAARPGGLEVFAFVSYDVPPPASGEVTVEVRAAGVNPADASHVAEGRRGPFPRGVGYEIAGVLTAIGPDDRDRVGWRRRRG